MQSQTLRATIGAGTALAVLLVPAAARPEPRHLSWGYNTLGVPGLIDMPSAMSRKDAEFNIELSYFKNQARINSTFQFTPRLSLSFRYSLLYHIFGPSSRLFDRSFSLHYQFLDEGRWRPAMAVGLNDIVGTGVYAGEYVVGTKTLTPRLRATLGMGWGRLGSFGGFKNPLGILSKGFETRGANNVGQGGNFDPSTWFHGNAALFGGIEWRASDRLRLIAEYSSDAYVRETGSIFKRRSPLNFALSYQVNPATTVAASFLYGSQIGLQLNHVFNPREPRYGSGNDPAPPPMVPRANMLRFAAAGADPNNAALARRIAPALAEQGLGLDGLLREGKTLRIEIHNDRYSIASQAVGRAARVLTRTAPHDIEAFAITLSENGMPVTTVTLKRDDLTRLEFAPAAPDLLRARTRITDATANLPSVPGRYPIVSWGISPYLTPALFDPDAPLRADLGVALSGQIEPRPGLVFSGALHRKLIGNLKESHRPSNSVLPHVRSDSALYYKSNSVTIPSLTAAYYFRPGHNLFGRVTAGLLEPMYGGISAELLWKPENSQLALGAEVDRVRQRGYDQLFDFRSYTATTTQFSAYYNFRHGYYGRLSVGSYLAGDVGATLEFDRVFDNGWRVGAFATKTNVSSATFGEGSFDKGIRLTIPLDWITGKPNQQQLDTVIRPILRDGGAVVDVPGRLYDTIRSSQSTALDPTWGRFWK